jgi:hypothetical protein
MEDFTLSVVEKTDLITGIKDNIRNITFSKGEFVFLKSFPGIEFKILNIDFPMCGSNIILLENSLIKLKIFVDPKDLVKIQKN